jgi:hypothetical protein
MDDKQKHDRLCELLTMSDESLLAGFGCACAERAQRGNPAPYKPLTAQRHRGRRSSR